jgi:uncharacterized OB-fold protein
MKYFFNKDYPKDQSYFCKCDKCGASYCGPKRSTMCWLCINPQLILGWEGTGKPVTAMDVIHRKGLILEENKQK